MKSVAFIAAAAALFYAHPAWAQAFGIQAGAAISSISVKENLGNGSYLITVPTPHPEFSDYVAVASDATGVCLVRGVGKSHDNDRFGNDVRDAFSSISKALGGKYGEHAHYDFLRIGSIWKDSDEWVMSIVQNERIFQDVWDGESKSVMPEDISEIILGVSAQNSSSSYLVLQYRFSNYEKCNADNAEMANSGL